MGEAHSKPQDSLQHGTSVDKQDSHGRSRLMIASANGDTQTVKSLLDEGAQVNLKDNGGASALLHACDSGLSLRDDTNDWDEDRWKLEIARLHEQIDIVKVLLDHGAQVDLLDENGISALIIASAYGHTETVKLLLDHGAQVDLQDKNGISALIIASMCGYTKTIEVLLDHGARVDLQKEDGIYALIFASRIGHTETVKVILDHGAQVDLQDENGDSALKVARDKGHHEIVQLLLDRGAHDTHGSHDSVSSGVPEHDKPVKLPQGRDLEISPQHGHEILEKHTTQITENATQTQITENTTLIAKLQQDMQCMFGNLKSSGNIPSRHPTSPTTRDVYRELLPLAGKWHNIGILLNIQPEKLDTIESNHPNRAEDCLRETVKEWLNGIDPRPTWEELVEAVKPVNRNIAEDIRIKYCT